MYWFQSDSTNQDFWRSDWSLWVDAATNVVPGHPDRRDEYGNTALLAALKMPDFPDYLGNGIEFLARQCEVDATDNVGLTALRFAYEAHSLKWFSYLVSRGANKSFLGDPLLADALVAIGTDDPRMLAAALDKGLSPDARDPFGCPLAIRAAGFESIACLHTLQSYGADWNAVWFPQHEIGDYGYSPLSVAANLGRLTSVALLIHYGADPDGPANGIPPLGQAAMHGQRDVSAALLKAGADWRIFDWNYFGEAATGDILPLLFLHGLADDTDIQSQIYRGEWSFGWIRTLLYAYGYTPSLRDAIETKNAEMIEQRLREGADPKDVLVMCPDLVERLSGEIHALRDDLEEWEEQVRTTRLKCIAAYQKVLAKLESDHP